MSMSVCTIIRHYAMFSLKSACLHPIFAATSLLLSGVMGTRFMRTGKFMPAGLVAGLRSDCEEIKISQLIFDNDLLSLCCMNLITFPSFQYCTSCSHVLPADEKVTLYVFLNKSGSCSREQADVCKSSFVVTVLVLIFLFCTYYKFT